MNRGRVPEPKDGSKSVLEFCPRPSSLSGMNILDELQWRGLVAATTMPPVSLDLNTQFIFPEALQEKPITVYAGFDPSADGLHVGSLVPLLALRRFQLLGHHPLPVAGGATGSIGDPSGKTQERQLLTREILERNIASVKVQLQNLLDFENKTNPARLLDNIAWTEPVSYLDF